MNVLVSGNGGGRRKMYFCFGKGVKEVLGDVGGLCVKRGAVRAGADASYRVVATAWARNETAWEG